MIVPTLPWFLAWVSARLPSERASVWLLELSIRLARTREAGRSKR